MAVFGYRNMPCYHPISAYRSNFKTSTGKHQIAFHPGINYQEKIQLPCGRCIGCRLEYSRQWAIRCVHESSLFKNNIFITLTYNDKHLPDTGSLIKRDFQLFMKSLRKKYQGIEPVLVPGEEGIEITYPVRFYHCGEYGGLNRRPHYHAIIFNLDFDDKEYWKTTKTGQVLYTSEKLSDVWGKGFITIGAVTFDSAAYVARYIMKKITGEQAERYYENIDIETGEIKTIIPEYTTMSRKPGIGTEWYRKYKNDCYPKDFLTINGKKIKPPKFYDDLYEHELPEEMEKLKVSRKQKQNEKFEDNTITRLAVKEKCKLAQLNQLKRGLEDET